MLVGSAFVAPASLQLSGCGMLPTSYRFRMTVEVQTPQGLRSGSSVMEVTAYKMAKLTSEEHSGSGSFRGQAVVVDLPDGPLFVLLKMNTTGSGLDQAVTLALRPDANTGHVEDYVKAVRALGATSGVKADLPRTGMQGCYPASCSNWPLMVRFRDINDPRSIEQVAPDAVGVKRILVETTRDPITIGLENRLPWLTKVDGGYIDGGFTSRNTPLGLDGTAFSTEIVK
jgi:hypothetical protein